MKKYELIDEYFYYLDRKGNRVKVYQIRALRDIYLKGKLIVKAGERGGFVESESNLSHEGSCWLFDKSRAIEQSMVRENAILRDNATVSGNAIIQGNATMIDFSSLRQRATLMDEAIMSKNASLVEDSAALGESVLTDDCCAGGSVLINGNSYIGGKAKLSGQDVCLTDCRILNNATINGKHVIMQKVTVADNVFINRPLKRLEIIGPKRLSGFQIIDDNNEITK